MIKLQCPKCGGGWILDGKACRRCGYRGQREEFIVKQEAEVKTETKK